MKRLLITGATGNVGREVINHLVTFAREIEIFAGVKSLKENLKTPFPRNVKLVEFDFENIATVKSALRICDQLFLLRPPHLSEVKKYFLPVIESAMEENIKHIVFLSVQGVENSKIIPHNKIEEIIVKSNIPYTFLRPAYFMQNFTTTLRSDLVKKKIIYLPARKAKFTLIDVSDIGNVAAKVLIDNDKHLNKAYELTCEEKLTFGEMAEHISSHLQIPIKFISPNPLSFFIQKRKEGYPTMLILVMIMLHYLPRFQKEPSITNTVRKIKGDAPINLDEFINDNLIHLKGV